MGANSKNAVSGEMPKQASIHYSTAFNADDTYSLRFILVLWFGKKKIKN